MTSSGPNKWSLETVTPGTVMGPFYPVAKRNQSAELVVHGQHANGQLLRVLGTVVDVAGRPAVGITVEIWQANGVGRYDHPSDPNEAPLDPNFLGSGMTLTDADGGYQFLTIMPAGYLVIPGWMRAPHIHFQLTGRCDRHVTQMWFPDHPLNQQDRLWANMTPAHRKRVTARLKASRERPNVEADVAEFNIVLPNA